MINLADPLNVLLAASGGDTVKLFDVSVKTGDPYTLSYTPSPRSQVNSFKWNHTSANVRCIQCNFGKLMKEVESLKKENQQLRRLL